MVCLGNPPKPVHSQNPAFPTYRARGFYHFAPAEGMEASVLLPENSVLLYLRFGSRPIFRNILTSIC